MKRSTLITPVVCAAAMMFICEVCPGDQWDVYTWIVRYRTNNEDGTFSNESMRFVDQEDAEKHVRFLRIFRTVDGEPKYTSITASKIPGTHGVHDQLSEQVDALQDLQFVLGVATDAKEKGLAKAAIDRFVEGIEERTFGDGIREYGRRLMDIYNGIMEFKRELMGIQGTLSRTAFDQANRRIQEYNQQAEAFNTFIESPPMIVALRAEGGRTLAQDILAGGRKAKRIEPLKPSDLRQGVEGQPAQSYSGYDLEGMTGTGTIGEGSVEMQFGDGHVTFTGEVQGEGQWSAGDRGILIETRTSIYSGAIRGDLISGTRQKKDGRSRPVAWSVRLGKQSFNLAGKRAEGTIYGSDPLAPKQSGRLTAVFKEGGVLLIKTDEDDQYFEGSWTLTGNQVEMRAGASVFQGTIVGKKLQGKRLRQGARDLVDTSDVWDLEVVE